MPAKTTSQLWLRRSLMIIGLGLILTIPWLLLAPLQSAAVAMGVVITEGRSKEIRHYDGGIVQKIAVTEGQYVKKDQLLVVMDDTIPRSRYEQRRSQYYATLAEFQRLQSELKELPEPVFTGELTDTLPAILSAKQNQSQRFHHRKEMLQGQRNILKEKVTQEQKQIESFHAQLRGDKDSLAAVSEQIQMQTPLIKKGLASKGRLLDLRIDKAEIEGRIGTYEAQVAKSRVAIAQYSLELNNLDINFTAEVSEEVQEAQTKLLQYKEELFQASIALIRTRILSPVNGNIVNLSIFTKGGIVSPRDTLMEIVPKDSNFIVEAMIDPKDIDVVHKGQPVSVRLTAYNFRSVPAITGIITNIAADSIEDQNNNQSAFPVQITLDPESLNTRKDIDLASGMQAEVMVLLGERTVFDYLISPLMQSYSKAFRESDV